MTTATCRWTTSPTWPSPKRTEPGPPHRRPTRCGATCRRSDRSVALARLRARLTASAEADGLLDVAAIDTVAGLAGWSSLARQVLPPYAAHYSESGRSLGRVMLRRSGEVAVQLSAPALVEVDGDLLAPTQGMRVRIDPGALLIRRPPT